MKISGWLTVSISLCLLSSGFAETVKDREGAVRNDRAALEHDTRWIYNDWQRGFEEAKRTGKPLLVVLRCIPCLACAGIDSRVLDREADFAPLLNQFVCVRVMNANALDLSLFQFDYDLSFSTIFFNGDGTVYGRYGSWRHQKDPSDKTTAGFTRALEAALEIHRDYPANKATLAGKQGRPTPYKTTVEIPSLVSKYKLDLDWNGKVVASCVHCHQIGDAFRLSYRTEGKPIPPELIYPMPAPETIGFTLAADQIAHAESVATGSIAARAGVQPGDDLLSMAGQPLVSLADVSWVLQQAREADTLPVVIKRNGKEKTLQLELPNGWRTHSDISKRVGVWGMRGMVTGGMVLEDLTDEARHAGKIELTALALHVKSVGQYGKHAAAKNAGFQQGDVIIALAGMTQRLTEGELMGQLLQKHPAGEKITATVLRGTERVELFLPMQ